MRLFAALALLHSHFSLSSSTVPLRTQTQALEQLEKFVLQHQGQHWQRLSKRIQEAKASQPIFRQGLSRGPMGSAVASLEPANALKANEAHHKLFENTRAPRGKKLWRIEFPNFLNGGFTAWLDEASGEVVRIDLLIEG